MAERNPALKVKFRKRERKGRERERERKKIMLQRSEEGRMFLEAVSLGSAKIHDV